MRPALCLAFSTILLGCGGGSPDGEPAADQAIADAMANDGVKRDTVKVFVLDKEFKY